MRAGQLAVATSGNLYLSQQQLLNDLLSQNSQLRMVFVIQDEVRPRLIPAGSRSSREGNDL
jgi:hypothetical protein